MKFKRSFSVVSPTKSKALREKIQSDTSTPSNGKPFHFLTMAMYTFWIFNSAIFPQECHKVFEEALIERALRDSLEKAKALNWCRTIKRLYPIATQGDGNCLLHAVSLALWGCTDSSLYLRRLMYVSLVEDGVADKFQQRWMHERMKLNALIPGGLQVNSRDWDEEWNGVVASTNPDSRTQAPNQLPFECLEEIHIYVLANILRRPIIVMSENVTRGLDGATLAPNNFSGIYFPLEWDPKDCIKNPICLGFDMNHFCPLVSMKDKEGSDVLAIDGVHGVPLVDNNFVPLKMHFLSERDETRYNIFYEYMHVDETPFSSAGKTNMVLYAKLAHKPLPAELDCTEDYINDCKAMIGMQTATRSVSPALMLNVENERSIPSAPLASNISGAAMAGLGSPEQGLVEHVQMRPTPLVMGNEPPRQHVNNVETSTRSRMVKELSMSGERCKTKNCKYYSSIETYPLCHRCYERNGCRKSYGRQISSSFPYVPVKEEEHHSSLEPFIFVGELCMTPGCQHYSVRHGQGYCSQHKVENVAHNESIGLVSPFQSPVAPSAAAAAGFSLIGHREVTMESSCCTKTGCTGVGSPKYNGLCQHCFLTRGDSDVLCRTSGCQFKAGVNGFCSQCSKKEEQKLMTASAARIVPEVVGTCKEPGCTFSGTSTQMGYCSQHYLENYGNDDVGNLNTTQILDRLPAMPAEESGKARSFYKCKTDTCSRMASTTPESKGYCFRCYVDKVRTNEMPLLPRKKKCTTEGCNNICLENSLGLCNSCFEDVQNERTPRRQQASALIESGPESLIESMSGRPKRCKKKHCNNYEGGNMNGMCEQCYKEFLTELKEMQMTETQPTKPLVKKHQCPRAAHKPTRKGYICSTPRCPRYGDKAFKGLCTQCYEERAHQRVRPAPVTYPVQYRSTAAHEQPPQMNDPFQEGMATTYNKARQSTARCKNCTNYANSKCHGYCNTCYPQFQFGSVVVDC